MKSYIPIILLLFLFLIFIQRVSSGQERSLNAQRIKANVTIDGILDEKEWDKANTATKFQTYEPSFGKTPSQKTRVYFLYDDNAIYIGAKMFDENPDKIFTELTRRDKDNGNTDMFYFQLNPNNDGLNMYEFKVTASNVQTDIKISNNNSDYDWDAVWKSKVNISDKGWTAEIKIPYSALRFPDKEKQSWSVNFWRVIRRKREIITWNPVKKSKGSDSEQMGVVTGLNNIEPPLRLSFYPYITTKINHYSENKEVNYGFSGGLDMKLGISKSHTLDMTLIPDFSQVKSDDQYLNLKPHEAYYSENRPFFTEGTDLFEKAGLFYSRRIGKIPEKYNEIRYQAEADKYKIIKNPRYSRLINALKITGRGENNLGIGILNAVTANTYATVEDKEGNEKRILTEPWANYNMLVLDQSFGTNSYFNLTNARVDRPDNKFSSNVLGTAFRIMESSNKYGVHGNAAWSYINDSTPLKEEKKGYMLSGGLGKLNGTLQYEYQINIESDSYNPNALGYLRQNDEISHETEVKYSIYEPFWVFNEFQSELEFYYDQLFSNYSYVNSGFKLWAYAETRKFLSIWSSLNIKTDEYHDYYEARTDGKVFKYPGVHSFNINLSSDYRKDFALDLRLNSYADLETRKGLYGSISPRFRISDKLTLIPSFNFDFDNNDKGYVENITNDSIVIGLRDVNTVVNKLDGKYVLNNKMYFDLIFRHYWRTVNYSDYFWLKDNGYLAKNKSYDKDNDINYNTFNIDLSYSWNFAPGSFVTLMWKNNIYSNKTIPESEKFPGFITNFREVLNHSQTNTISLRFIYYLDWQYFS